jgi:malonyl-CoA/methylmalonyl-CoA synthetase
MAEPDVSEGGMQSIKNAALHKDRVAIVDAGAGAEYTYGELNKAARAVAGFLLDEKIDLSEARVAFLVPPSFDYVATLWGIWLAGGIAVPLCSSHPPPEWETIIEDSAAETIVSHPDFAEKLRPIAETRDIRFVLTGDAMGTPEKRLHDLDVDIDRRAMILYTSGTTGRPKGVVSTHRNITAQITSLAEAWGWTSDDRILHVLPLHHVHGIVNVLLCALWSGATCEFLPSFDADAVWGRFVNSDLTLFMAVPTIYFRLIAAWESASRGEQRAMSKACAKMRLMVSGSAALPVSLFEKWQTISGHTLLERYGMTEIGMALSNPLDGERRPGHVGVPLPGVTARLAGESGSKVAAEGLFGEGLSGEGESGEIQIKGPNVFLEYWRRPEATQQAFHDGWFCTGDVAVIKDGYWRILGRSSVDIIKTGGYKVSALEVEEVLRTHPAITECAVVGVEDAEWGERVCAAIILKAGETLSHAELREWAKERLASYKAPTRILYVDELPRNVMGKVTKPDVKTLFN